MGLALNNKTVGGLVLGNKKVGGIVLNNKVVFRATTVVVTPPANRYTETTDTQGRRYVGKIWYSFVIDPEPAAGTQVVVVPRKRNADGSNVAGRAGRITTTDTIDIGDRSPPDEYDPTTKTWSGIISRADGTAEGGNLTQNSGSRLATGQFPFIRYTIFCTGIR